MAHGLVQHVVRIELPGQLPAGPREPLRQRPGAALALVELAALEGTARGAGDVAGELELLLGEDLLAREEDQHEPGSAARAPRAALPGASGCRPQRLPAREPCPKRLSSPSCRDASTFPARAHAVKAAASSRR